MLPLECLKYKILIISRTGQLKLLENSIVSGLELFLEPIPRPGLNRPHSFYPLIWNLATTI